MITQGLIFLLFLGVGVVVVLWIFLSIYFDITISFLWKKSNFIEILTSKLTQAKGLVGNLSFIFVLYNH